MPKLGLECKLFYGTAGSQAATELTKIKGDLNLNIEKGEADATTRDSNGWRITVGTLKEASIDFDLLAEPGDAGFEAIQSAFFAGTPIAIFVTDGAGSGLDCDASITKFSRNEPFEDVVTYSVSLKPTIVSGSSGRAPQWITGSSSSSSASA